MKPRTDLLVNAACLFVISPLLGMMAAGLVVGILEALLWTVAAVAGMVASIFFDVNFASIASRTSFIRSLEMWVIFGGGSIGGLIWSTLEIRERWQRHKMTGRGW